MSTDAAAPAKKSNTGIIVFGSLIVLALIGGAIYLLSKSAKPESTTSTTSTANTGLSGLLAGINITDLQIL
jgi:hypothetical protein